MFSIQTSIVKVSFSLQIEKSLLLHDEIYIAGEINIDFKDGNAANNKWKHAIKTHDLSQHINTPTRVTAHSETIIDHVYVSASAHMTDISGPNIAISDYYPVSFTLTTTKVQFKRQEHVSIQYRTFNQFNEDSFLEYLSEQTNTLVISHTDTNANFSIWTSNFMAVFDKRTPLRQKKKKKKWVKRETHHEWANDELRLLWDNARVLVLIL